MIDRNSLKIKIILPIFALVTFLMLFLLFTAYKLSNKVTEDYSNFVIEMHSSEINKILDIALTELTTARLLDAPTVEDAKKKEVIDSIGIYLSANNLGGFIKTPEKEIIFLAEDEPLINELKAYASSTEGLFRYEKDFHYVVGKTIDYSPWDWKVVLFSKPETILIYKNEVVYLLPATALCLLLILFGMHLILNKNLRRPFSQIIADIKDNKKIRNTDISEIDILGSAINNSLESLNRKTIQLQALHSIAISMHEDTSPDRILNLIIDKSSQLINSELAAIALYDEQGRFKSLVTKGATIKLREAMPEGKGLLEFIRLSVTPVRINNLSEHPAFSGSFPDGHPIIKNLLAYPIFSSEGKPIGSLYFGNKDGGFTEDDEILLKAISADTALAISKSENIMQLKRFKHVIDSAFDVILITDADGYIEYANPAFESVTEYKLQEVIGKKTNILKSGMHDELFYKELWDTIKSGKIWKGEFINKKKSGEIYYASAIIFPIYYEGNINYAAIQRDITTEKKLYEQLLRAQKMEAIGTLAGGIAHDFNNILTAILGYSEIMLSLTKEGDPFYKPSKIINDAALKGADLAKKILTVSRKEKLEARPININEVVINSVELIQRSIPKNIEIFLNLSGDIPLIMADPSQMHQVIINLAVNARDAMPEGGRLTIETSLVGKENGAANGLTSEKGGFVKLSISDTGVGIDKEVQKRIFDPFFTTKDISKGTGLGLYIVHSIINNHGGYINLYSEPGKGTRFNIYLPISKITEKLETESYPDLRGSETILIIDDEPDIRELGRDLLEPLGYNVLVAEDGNSGIRVFRENKDIISLVILDMIMPKMSGSEVFQILKTIKEDVKVIICSGYSEKGFAGIDKLLSEGASSFVQKPFTKLTIAKAVKEALSD